MIRIFEECCANFAENTREFTPQDSQHHTNIDNYAEAYASLEERADVANSFAYSWDNIER